MREWGNEDWKGFLQTTSLVLIAAVALMAAKFVFAETPSVVMKILAGLAQLTGVFGVALNIPDLTSLLFIGAHGVLGFYAGATLRAYWAVPVVCFVGAVGSVVTFCLLEGFRPWAGLNWHVTSFFFILLVTGAAVGLALRYVRSMGFGGVRSGLSRVSRSKW